MMRECAGMVRSGMKANGIKANKKEAVWPLLFVYLFFLNLAKNPFFLGGVGIAPPRTLLIWVM